MCADAPVGPCGPYAIVRGRARGGALLRCLCFAPDRSEEYLDKHFDNRHMDKLPEDATVCLADYCDVLQCHLERQHGKSSTGTVHTFTNNIAPLVSTHTLLSTTQCADTKAKWKKQPRCIDSTMRQRQHKCNVIMHSCLGDVPVRIACSPNLLIARMGTSVSTNAIMRWFIAVRLRIVCPWYRRS